MSLTEAPAIGNNLIPHFNPRVRRGFDCAGKIDARDNWKCTKDRRATRKGDPVLVVDG